MRVGLVKEDIYLDHITDDFHPENPGRLRGIYEMLGGDRPGGPRLRACPTRDQG